MIDDLAPLSTFSGDPAQALVRSTTVSRGLAAQRTVVWLVLGAAGAVLVAWIAIQAQNHGVAPIGLAAIAIGVTVAEINARAAKLTEIGNPRLCVAGAIGLAVLVILAQEYVGFREHLADLGRFQSANPKAALAADASDVGPAAFFDYLSARARQSPILLGVDATLTIAGAIGWTIVRGRNLAASTLRSAEQTPADAI